MAAVAGFDELFDKQSGPLLRLATAITGNRESGAEVVQEAFTRALARWRRLARYDTPAAWLRRVVIRLAVRERTRAGRHVTAVIDSDVAPFSRDLDLEVALGQLPAIDRALVVLRYFDDMTIAEVADAVQLRPNTVEVRLHRARRKLRELLEAGHVRI